MMTTCFIKYCGLSLSLIKLSNWSNWDKQRKLTNEAFNAISFIYHPERLMYQFSAFANYKLFPCLLIETFFIIHIKLSVKDIVKSCKFVTLFSEIFCQEIQNKQTTY